MQRAISAIATSRNETGVQTDPEKDRLKEEEFCRSRIELTSRLFRRTFVCSLVVCALFTSHGIFHGHTDVGPALGCFMMLPLMAVDYLRPYSRTVRQSCIFLVVVYISLRLCPWDILGWPIAPTVKEGYALPYSILAPSMLILVGSSIGLRIRDLLVAFVFTSLIGMMHLFLVLDSTMAFIYGGLQVGTSTAACFSLHHDENLQRSWFQGAHMHQLPDAEDKDKLSRNDNNPTHFSAEMEARYAQELLAAGKPIYILPSFLIPVSLWTIYLLAGSSERRVLITKLEYFWRMAAIAVIVCADHFTLYTPNRGKWRHRIFVAGSVFLNARNLIFIPTVVKAFGMEVPQIPFFYPVSIYPWHFAIGGPMLVITVGGLFGLRLADSAPHVVASLMTGIWNLHEVMHKCPFSRMNYICSCILCTLEALWAYWSMEYEMRRAWLVKIEAEAAFDSASNR